MQNRIFSFSGNGLRQTTNAPPRLISLSCTWRCSYGGSSIAGQEMATRGCRRFSSQFDFWEFVANWIDWSAPSFRFAYALKNQNMTRPANIAAPIAKLVIMMLLSIISKIPPGRRPWGPGACCSLAPNQRTCFCDDQHPTIPYGAAAFQFKKKCRHSIASYVRESFCCLN